MAGDRQNPYSDDDPMWVLVQVLLIVRKVYWHMHWAVEGVVLYRALRYEEEISKVIPRGAHFKRDEIEKLTAYSFREFIDRIVGSYRGERERLLADKPEYRDFLHLAVNAVFDREVKSVDEILKETIARP
ncbi:MAG: hypothetical protein A2666_03920 [Parcubacteria group bacterium RIFCSPHIGHO2_01_FULL_47_10b]|nr:MAG: hypothetical protein A2666_03920 [Parcubacteria group bacterium RIFCSPHIGHO2_01_FULL_47_10b]